MTLKKSIMKVEIYNLKKIIYFFKIYIEGKRKGVTNYG